MPLNELLDADRIGILVAPDDRAAVLDAAARLLSHGIAGRPDASLAAAIGDSLRNREDLASTAIGYGVAIPHARMPGLEESHGAFLRLSQPVDFRAADGHSVDLVLAMAVPEHFVQQHLLQLADLAERFASASFRDALRAATTVAEMRQLLLADDTRRSAA